MARFLVLGFALLLINNVQAQIVISEFLAENNGFHFDQDGESPDWIEIHNTSAAPANLAGWHLSDSPTNLTRWTFPSVVVPADGYLVVFASGKNRAVSGRELHTDFSLENAGEYLALVMPGGAIAHAYNGYPEQRANRSFGISDEAVTTALVQSGATARVLVPLNGALGNTWTNRTFADNTWSALATPIGYDLIGGTTNILSLDFDERNSTPQTMAGFRSFVISSNGGAGVIQTTPITRQYDTLSVTVSQAGQFGYDDRVRPQPTNSPAFTGFSLLRDFIFSQARTNNDGFDVTIAGLPANAEYTATLWSFDASSPGRRVSDWYANGVLAVGDYTFDGSVPPSSDSSYRFSFPAQSDPTGQVVIGGRRDSTSVSPANAPEFGVFLNALMLQQLGYGFFIAGDLSGSMAGQNSSAYLRVHFPVSDPSAMERLRLRVHYDDGFVAYLNGQLVASRNAPGSLAWSSTATVARSAAQGLTPEEIVIPNAPGLLVNGDNVLAIQGLNVDAADNDFLLHPQLDGEALLNTGGRYFAVPTPGARNGASYAGFVADTKFSVDRGFFETPFSVAITSATPGVEIRWTRDGSAPSPTNGFVYTTPIAVTNTSFIRAAAFAPGLIPTESDTHTYIFLDRVIRQSSTQPGYPTTWQASYPADYGMDPNVVNHPNYTNGIRDDLRSIPTLSLVSAHSTFWDAATGIYIDATRRTEHAASVELFSGDGSTEFQVNCGVEMHGNASRDNARLAKHSFRLQFQSSYGPSKLNYDWFSGPGAESFDTIVLRACFTDSWATRYSDQTIIPGGKGTRYRPEDSIYLRDVWMRDSMRDLGHLSSRSSFVHLYVNGLYWGLYNPSERLDGDYFAEHLGGLENDWDVMAGDEVYDFAEVRNGNRADWDALMALANAGVTTEAAYQAIAQRIDVENLIDFMMLHIFAEAEDWPHHNWYAAHRRANATNGLSATKWIFLAWDQEIVLDQLVRRNQVNVGNLDTPARIYSQLRAYPEFRRLFGDRVHKHLFHTGALTPSNNIARLSARAAQINGAIVGESARWGDARVFTIGSNPGHGRTFTRDEWWIPELNKLYTNFFPGLTAANVARFRAAGLYPNIAAPEFSQFGGDVPAGFQIEMAHTNASGTIFYTLDGRDPRTYSTGAVSPSAQAYSGPVPINTPTVVRARVQVGLQWSALVEATFFPPQDYSKLVLTEIMYAPPNDGFIDGDEFEFIELKNTGTNTLNLTGLGFSEGIGYAFTNDTLLAAGAFWVIARNPDAFGAKYPGVVINDLYGSRMNNDGERLTLSHALGQTIFSVEFSDAAPWPVAADGYGFSLVQKEPITSQAPDNGGRWRASSLRGGSPGADDPLPTVAPILINEILTASTAPDIDKIELYNPTMAEVNIGGWLLSDDRLYPWKYRIPADRTIPAHGVVVISESEFGSVVLGTNAFALSSRGDELYLFSADANTNLTGHSHGVSFEAADPGVSFGRYINSVGDEQFPAQVASSFNAANLGPLVGPVVINEIHYHPGPDGDEFVELKNISGSSVPLADASGTWRLNGAGFSFPAGAFIEAQSYVLVVATNPAAFRAKFAVPAGIPIFGPFTGVLQDSGERLRLEHPIAPDTNGSAYVTVDDVRYNDRAPWSAAADGSGPSLQRKQPGDYGNDPINWDSAPPTPGRANTTTDSDGDGMPDEWELANGTQPGVADGHLDSDNDGRTNFEEYLAGTHPNNPASRFLLAIDATPSVSFDSALGRTYTLEYSTDLADWIQALAPSNGTGSAMTLTPPPAPGGFYRLRVERQ